MKYETLRKGLLARREKCLAANGKASWYKEEKEKLESAMAALEDRHKKSSLSNDKELAAVDEMLAIIDRIVNPEEKGAAEIAQENQQASTSAMRQDDDPDMPPALRKRVLPPPVQKVAV